MAAAYSLDLRGKIVQACERGTQSQREVAEFFGVSLSFVEALLGHYRRSGGELEPQRKRPGRHALLDETHQAKLRQWLEEQSDLTLKELICRLHAATGTAVSEPTMSRVLQHMGMHRKKRPYTPRNKTARVYVWHAAGSADRSSAMRSKN